MIEICCAIVSMLHNIIEIVDPMLQVQARNFSSFFIKFIPLLRTHTELRLKLGSSLTASIISPKRTFVTISTSYKCPYEAMSAWSTEANMSILHSTLADILKK